MLFCRLLIFFKISFFEKFFQECHQCQTVWIQIRPDILSGLIWVQTVCRGNQQMTLIDKELNTCHHMSRIRIFFLLSQNVIIFLTIILTHISLRSFLLHVGKQRRPRSDTANAHLIRISSVCSQNYLVKFELKMKNTTELP